MRKPAIAASVLITLVLAVAGCGDTVDKNAYVKSVGAVQAQTSKDAETLSSQMSTAKTPADIASKLNDLGVAVQADSKKLAAITPPKEVATEHKQYVALINDFGTSLEDLASKVKKATPTTVGTVLTQASSITTNLSTKESAIVNAINTKLQK